jgi:hypothetical protein
MNYCIWAKVMEWECKTCNIFENMIITRVIFCLLFQIQSCEIFVEEFSYTKLCLARVIMDGENPSMKKPSPMIKC